MGEAEKKALRGISLLEYKICVSWHTHIWGQLVHVQGKERQEADNTGALDTWVSLQYLTYPFAFTSNQKPDLGARESPREDD